MTGTLNSAINTDDLIRLEPKNVIPGPPLDPPTKSPFYITNLPTTSVTVSPDNAANFRMPGIPQRRIVPPVPLTLAASGANTVPKVVTSTFNIIAPPAPTIAQSLSTIPTGYQFSFNQVQLPLNAANGVACYKVYRSSSSDSSSATVIQTVAANTSQIGVPIFIQDAQPNGDTQFYFVSTLSVNGRESNLTPAQSGPVVANSIANSNSQLASSAHLNALNSTFSATNTTTLSNDGSHTVVNVGSSTNQFGIGPVSYNSGSVDPGGVGTWYVYTDDPLYQGGAVIYQATAVSSDQAAGDARISFGAISTVGGTSKTGGGTTGGTTPGGGPSRVPTL